jgi:hypothetical protein
LEGDVKALARNGNLEETRNIKWHTQTLTFGPDITVLLNHHLMAAGWSVRGIWPKESADGTDINTLDRCALVLLFMLAQSQCRSHNSKLVATGDDFSFVKLFKFPACTEHVCVLFQSSKESCINTG